MKPFDVYKIMIAMQLHFKNEKYDILKYGFKNNKIKYDSFLRRNDKYFYNKIAKKYSTEKEIVEFIIANLINNISWVGNMTHENYLIWIGKNISQTYIFKTDLYNVVFPDNDIEKYLISSEMYLIYDLIKENISLETAVIFDKIFNFTSKIKDSNNSIIGIDDIILKIKKYKPFLKINNKEEIYKLIENKIKKH